MKHIVICVCLYVCTVWERRRTFYDINVLLPFSLSTDSDFAEANGGQISE